MITDKLSFWFSIVKRISIRQTVESDLTEIFEIRTDPKVAIHQYPLLPNDSLGAWRYHILENNVVNEKTIRHSTITKENRIIGHIIHHHYEFNGIKMVQCGWNLTPDEWGNGFMKIALIDQFNAFFNDENVKHIFADCFPTNSRCIRLIKGLGFVRQSIPLLQRLLTAYASKCLRRIIRFRLDSDQWNQMQSQNA